MRDFLQGNTVVGSTKRNYHVVWTNFNKFIIKLDHIPAKWEERTSLYCTYLILEGYQSSTVKSYVSAIKHKLTADNYKWDDKLVLLNSLTKACRLENDVVKVRLPLQHKLLNMVIFEVEREFISDEYSRQLYKTLFLIGYSGMFRVGELTKGKHVIKVPNVHISHDNKKASIYLYSSKTLRQGSKPQRVKLDENNTFYSNIYQPVAELRTYANMRPEYISEDEQFFVHADLSPATPSQMRKLLRKVLERMGLESKLYDIHSLRIGRATDLFNSGVNIERIKEIGRWRSNAVYKYLRG